MALLAAPAVLVRIYLSNLSQEKRRHMTLPSTESTASVLTATKPTSKRKRILVVEDQAGLREILVQILGREHYLVDAAGCLAEARLALMVHVYDLLVLDLLLPDGSGYGLIEWLTSGAAWPLPRILVLSQLTDVDDFLLGHAAGVDDYIGKPFEFDDLLHTVERLLS